MFEQLHAEALATFDRIMGLDLSEVSGDGSLHKALNAAAVNTMAKPKTVHDFYGSWRGPRRAASVAALASGGP